MAQVYPFAGHLIKRVGIGFDLPDNTRAMHRLVPNFILKKQKQERSTGTFPAVALFVDIAGFSAMTVKLTEHGEEGAEVLATVMRAVFEPLMISVYGYGGFVANMAGDAITALFRDTEGEEETAAIRGLAAAWEIQQWMINNAAHNTRFGRFDISAKAGLSRSQVEWGVITAEEGERAAFYFRGSAIDGSAAAESLAQAGEIMIDEEIYAQTRQWVSAERVGERLRLTDIGRTLPRTGVIDLPPLDLEQAVRFFPDLLPDKPYRGEFRQIVHLFINLPTVRTAEQLLIFMRLVFALQAQYGGLLNRLDFGDKGAHLVLFWGAPVSHENDIARTLNFVLDLQARSSIPIHAGATYDFAYAGFIGSDLRAEFTCYGRGVNLAARLMVAAPRGEIWVDEELAVRARSQFDLELEGERHFKGFSESQKVYTIFERREALEPALHKGALVGREMEMARLADFVQPVFQGRYAGVLLVRGEAGIGKSRLLYEFRSAIFKGRPALLWGHCQTDEILRRSLNPFRYCLRIYFGLTETQVEARNKRNFNRRLDQLIAVTSDPVLAKELDRTRSSLGALVGLRWPDSLYEQLDAQGRYENTFTALTTLLRAESLKQPMLVLLEDVQWLDTDSKALLPEMVRAVTADAEKSYPVAFIATARPGAEEPILGDGVAYEEISLGPLPPDGLDRLAAEHLGVPAAPGLLRMLQARAEGNPFFAEQILRYLLEHDLLVETGRGSEVTTPPMSLLPTDVRTLLVARLDRLPQELKELVQAASIFGREFDIRVLGRILHLDAGEEKVGTLERLISAAERAEIWVRMHDSRYTFKHALLRDAAYQMQSRARRKALHALAVEALESLHLETDERFIPYAEMAFHAEEGDLANRACLYLRPAGEQAAAAFQNSLAVDYYGRALALLPAEDIIDRYELLLAREDVWHLQGKRKEQQEDLAVMADLAAMTGDDRCRAEVGLRHSRYAGAIGEHGEAIAAAQDVVNIGLNIGRDDLSARGYRLWGWYLLRQASYDESRQRLEQSLTHAGKAGKAALEADSLNSLGALFSQMRDHEAALTHYQQARALYQQTGNRLGEARTWNNQGVVASQSGQYAVAVKYYEQALTIRRQIGDRRGEGNTLNNLGGAYRILGRYARARECYEESLTIRSQIGDLRGVGLATLSLGILASNLGQYGTAEEKFLQSLAIFEQIGDRMLVTTTYTNLGGLAVELERYEEGRIQYQKSLELAREIGQPHNEAYALHGLGDAMLGLGRLEEAMTFYEEAIAMRLELDHPLQLIDSRAGLAMTALAMGDSARAEALVKTILEYLDVHPLTGSEEPYRVYLTCIKVLEQRSDPRAVTILEQAHGRLQQQAARISDADARHSFLNNVNEHRSLVAAYQKLETRRKGKPGLQ